MKCASPEPGLIDPNDESAFPEAAFQAEVSEKPIRQRGRTFPSEVFSLGFHALLLTEKLKKTTVETRSRSFLIIARTGFYTRGGDRSLEHANQ